MLGLDLPNSILLIADSSISTMTDKSAFLSPISFLKNEILFPIS
jgi:hypothetical protein